MDKGTVHIYCGKGKGKTTAAIGQAIKAACEGRNVVIIEFLKAKEEDELGFLKRLEPEIKVFRFEKFQECFEDLPEEKREEEILNMKNALNFARKVLVTEECDVLILDEVLGLIPLWNCRGGGASDDSGGQKRLHGSLYDRCLRGQRNLGCRGRGDGAGGAQKPACT